MADSSDRQSPRASDGHRARRLLDEQVKSLREDGHGVQRMYDLLSAVVGVGSQVGVVNVGKWIVTTAARVGDARYAALGVLDPDGERRLSEFITVGIDDQGQALIGDSPHGRGLLGLLIDEPKAIRLPDLNRHPAAHGFPAHHPAMSSFLGVPVLVRGQVYGNLYLTEKRGGGQFTQVDEQLLTALATAAGLAMQNAQLYEQARQQRQWLEASRDLTTMLLAGSPATEVFPLLVACVRELAGADTAFLALPVDDGTARVEVAVGLGAERMHHMVLPEHSMSAQVMVDDHPVAVADARDDRRIWQGVIEAADAGPALFVRLGTADEAVGTLVVTNRRGGPSFSTETITLIESIAGQAAISLRLGVAAKDREELAVLGDRDRIARDLHDLVIQRLFATGMSLEGAVRGMQPVQAVDRVRRAVDDLDDTIREIRSTIFALQAPAPLVGEGLRSAIRQAVRASSSTLGFEPRLRLEGPLDLLVPPAVAEQMLAVLRESLSNVAHHAQATRVTVTVTVTPSEVCLTVQDNGIGLPAEGRRSGLANLARRANDLGGRFDARATKPDGTAVEWLVPLTMG